MRALLGGAVNSRSLVGGMMGNHMEILGSDHAIAYAVVTHPYLRDSLDYVHLSVIDPNI